MIALFWLDGASAALRVVEAVLVQGRLPLAVGLWALWIAPRLGRRLPNAWRAATLYASVTLALALSVAVAIGVGFVAPSALEFHVLGVRVADVSSAQAVGLGMVGAAVGAGQLAVLRQRTVRALFAHGSAGGSHPLASAS
jgi:hypothetical protein